MANTMISISSITTNPEEIIISGRDLDEIFLKDGDLAHEFNEVTFSFDRTKKNEMAYVFKIASSKAKEENSLQAMFEKMVKTQAIVTINDGFKIK